MKSYSSPYIFIQEIAFEHVVWKMAAICLDVNVLISQVLTTHVILLSQVEATRKYNISRSHISQIRTPIGKTVVFGAGVVLDGREIVPFAPCM